jgi:hypothetical protein
MGEVDGDVDMGQGEDHGFELRNSTECQGGEWGETEAKIHGNMCRNGITLQL